MTIMKKMPKLATLLLSGFVGLFTLATIACTGPIRKAVEQSNALAQHALDVQEIQNVMSKHAYYYAAGERQRELDDIWAMQTQGVSWGTDEGFWVDAKEIQPYYVRYFDTVRARELAPFNKMHPEVKENHGPSMFQANSNPVIEIAGDGYTAKGLWCSLGQVIQMQGGKPVPTYVWEQHGVDFYKPDKNWKIWHFFVHVDGVAAPGQSAVPGPGGQGALAGLTSDAPAPSVRVPRDDKGAGPYATPSGYLKVPQPYRTFSLTFSYGPPNDR